MEKINEPPLHQSFLPGLVHLPGLVIPLLAEGADGQVSNERDRNLDPSTHIWQRDGAASCETGEEHITVRERDPPDSIHGARDWQQEEKAKPAGDPVGLLVSEPNWSHTIKDLADLGL